MGEPAREIVRTLDAVDRIVDALSGKLHESIPQITAAASASGQPSSVALKIGLKPDKDLPQVWHVEITERLSLASAPIDASARIEHDGDAPQLSLSAYFSEE